MAASYPPPPGLFAGWCWQRWQWLTSSRFRSASRPAAGGAAAPWDG